ncbi:MAG: acyl-CoA synthetase [Alphaproteobacteria bacterium]|nr:acyl-CoA synthetase [Alphaproteobacteria bacterium]
MPGANPYETGLDACAANYVPLSPLSLLARAAAVYPERVACIHGPVRTSYRDLFARCRRLASALRARGIRQGDTVAVMAPNVPALLEAHYGVPAAGAVLNALNVRLDPATVAFILDHSEAKVLIADRTFSSVVKPALASAKVRPLVIDIDDPLGPEGERLGAITYEDLLATGDPAGPWTMPDDEWRAISLNYTSGTTGNPKGVVYHHRGAYLEALGGALAWGLRDHPVFLWTLPMFHCNGWTMPWAMSVVAGTHVCLRKVDPALVFATIVEHRVTHMAGAPIVLNMLANAPAAAKRTFDRTIEVATGGASPPAAIIAAMAAMGFRITHLYGLTETYGPATICAWQEKWNDLDPAGRAAMTARQGVHYPTQEDLMVADPATLVPVPSDGATLGEVCLRGNTVMKGYLKNPKATAEAFAGGWFHTGDLAVRHGDGYIEVKDRSKDIIISGGENISTIEVESALYHHPAVLEAAVVARPDEKWGETPCAFVALKDGARADGAELQRFCRERLAHFKVPRTFVFGPLPKTSTGKIQKYVLRERAKGVDP